MISILWLLIMIAVIVGLWKMFEKAGQPGWAAVVPFYNVWVLVKIIDKPWWWFVLLFVPVLGLVMHLLISLEVSNRFGQGTGFGLGIFFLPFVFYPILGFGEYRYQ